MAYAVLVVLAHSLCFFLSCSFFPLVGEVIMQQALRKQSAFPVNMEHLPPRYPESWDVLTKCVQCGHLSHFWHVITRISEYQDVEEYTKWLTFYKYSF